MSVVRARTNSYGPATLDVQIEQGADFRLGVTAKVGASPLNLTGAVITAKMQSSTPAKACVTFTVEATDLANGEFSVVFPSASSLLAPFNALPSQEIRPTSPEKYPIGAWRLQWLLGGVTTVYCEGTVYLDRDPCLM